MLAGAVGQHRVPTCPPLQPLGFRTQGRVRERQEGNPAPVEDILSLPTRTRVGTTKRPGTESACKKGKAQEGSLEQPRSWEHITGPCGDVQGYLHSKNGIISHVIFLKDKNQCPYQARDEQLANCFTCLCRLMQSMP